MAARLDAERSDYRPAELDLERRHLPTLTWAGFTFAAWGRGEEAPEPGEKPFSWLPSKWGRIAFPPAPTEPEPPKPEPNPRRITNACGICGDTPRPAATVTGREGRAWGLANKGGMVETVFCAPCASAAGRPITGYGQPLTIAAATTRRLATEQPEFFKRLGIKSGYLSPAALVGRRLPLTWANATIELREAGDPDPEPRPGRPFFWLATKPKPTPDAPRFAALAAHLAERREPDKT